MDIGVIYQEMEEMFGDRLPNFDHHPIKFAYYVKLYLYEKGLKNVLDSSSN